MVIGWEDVSTTRFAVAIPSELATTNRAIPTLLYTDWAGDGS